MIEIKGIEKLIGMCLTHKDRVWNVTNACSVSTPSGDSNLKYVLLFVTENADESIVVLIFDTANVSTNKRNVKSQNTDRWTKHISELNTTAPVTFLTSIARIMK